MLNYKIIGNAMQQVKDGFPAAENTVEFDIALTKKVGAGMFGSDKY